MRHRGTMWLRTLGCALWVTACGGDDGNSDTAGATMSTTNGTVGSTGVTASATATETTTSGPTSQTGSDTGFKFDVMGETESGETGVGPSCKAVDNPVGACRQQAPPDSFEPDIQWDWWGPDGEEQSSVITLVANLTDDNADDEIDLCDVPDVIVVATAFYAMGPGHIYVLDGETGAEHFKIQPEVNSTVTPAIGDIDGDGLPEIVMMSSTSLMAFEHDGTMKWQTAPPRNSNYMAVALADLDNDMDVEIIVGNFVADHNGQTVFEAPDFLWTANDPIYLSASTAADLDGDGDLELVLGRSAYHHDGSQYYMQAGVLPGYPQVADLDGDPQPEVLVNNNNGITVLEHDGTPKYQDLRPTNDPPGYTWYRPSTIHDFDGDNISEYAVSSATHYSVYEQDASIVWTADVVELSCCAAGTAFDFLGDSVAEAMYADETNLFIFDGMGLPLLSTPRSSWTNIEYPVVADIDNDGSAEILVVSNEYPGIGQTAPSVQAIRDVQDRWIQARRIWNQHTYHVTNVREDGVIPQFEDPAWEQLNTFRTNAQIEGGGVCKPEG